MRSHFLSIISHRTAVAVIIALAAVACQNDDSGIMAPHGDPQRGMLLFSINPAEIEPSGRGVSYDGLKSSFSDGTLVGCVIAYLDNNGKPQYKANSCWTYTGGNLSLSRLYDENNAPIDIGSAANNILRHFTDEELSGIPADDSFRPYYINLLDASARYAFYFYYPYIDETMLTATLGENFYNDGSLHARGSNIHFPSIQESGNYDFWQKQNRHEVYSSYFLISPIAKTESAYTASSMKLAAWTKYPVAPMVNFAEETGTTVDRLNNSDFMYAAVTTDRNLDITKENATSPIAVKLRKQMVTIDLCFADTDPSQVMVCPKSENNYPVMQRIRYFDLSYGYFNGAPVYESNTWDQTATAEEKNAKYSSYIYIYPRKIGTSQEWNADGVKQYHVYRLILPPQNKGEFMCDIKFTVDGTEKTLSNVQKNAKLEQLIGGTYYKLRFSKSPNDTGWHLLIEDWVEGGGSTLDRPGTSN